MKVIFRLLPVTIILFSSVVFAQTTELILACHTDPIVEEYMLEFDGVTSGPHNPISDENGYTLVLDILSLVIPDTQHVVKLAGINAWGDVGEWSAPFDFTWAETSGVRIRTVPAAPVGLFLISQ